MNGDIPDTGRIEGDAFLTRLRQSPRPTFAASLYERLQQQEAEALPWWGAWHWYLPRGFASHPRVAAVAVTLFLTLCTAPAWPALAQPVLEHFAPRQVTALPRAKVRYESPPAGLRMMAQEEVEQRVGFRLLVPAYLPNGCQEIEERFVQSVPNRQAVVLNYPCVSISEMNRLASGLDRPYIGEGSSEEVTVGGEPALYIDGSWVATEGQEPVWTRGLNQQLIFERNGLLIVVTNRVNRASKADLVRVAESLR